MKYICPCRSECEGIRRLECSHVEPHRKSSSCLATGNSFVACLTLGKKIECIEYSEFKIKFPKKIFQI